MASHAFLLNTSIDEAHRTANALGYAADLHDAGHTVRVYLDGPATQWPGYMLRNPGDPVVEAFKRADDRELIAGVCRHCAERSAPRTPSSAPGPTFLTATATPRTSGRSPTRGSTC